MEVKAMLYLCTGTDFGLSKDSFNTACALEWLKKPSLKVVEQFSRTTLYQVGDTNDGYYFLYSQELNLVGYYMRYKSKKDSLLGTSVTQVAIWRALSFPNVNGLTKKMFFNLLLAHKPCILSDMVQTEAGKGFWASVMQDGLDLGYEVGLADFNTRKIKLLTSSAEVRLCTNNAADDFWSSDRLQTHCYKNKRFFIRKKT